MIRTGGPADADTMLAFLDEAVAWMVERGQSDQWGSEPWSAQPKRVARVRAMAESGLLWIAEVDGAPAGALVLGDPPEEIPPVDEPEVYIRFLITSRRLAGRGIGSDLLDFARAHTRALGIGLLRVDCWAGGGGRLVEYYVRNGFTPSAMFAVGDWPGQVLEQRVD
ncbi:Acetyltransferase (GNAT) family protein [Actinokineospora alba]|uniref:Acetyltransferase (GNAT) family protein n=2 Tax=Actinokineospora alba TaxID=504798 RepID=A0A1H0LNC1_9PSEU|nr:acetyltransferase (GNAT) family protein [Actinokineospora alba]SDI98237.1 Acetyltransferase (GNAT) family protein [Actinokineospora alba]SDO69491.1 Acetyltransferase (GNAT) family protein [Actinokineospora alba]